MANAFWKDDIRRAAPVRQHVDVGTSGEVSARERRHCLMIGSHLDPIFTAVAMGTQYARIVRARWETDAEVFDIPKNARCEALPEAERFNLDLADIAEAWRRGSVITSWLLDLAASTLAHDPSLDASSGSSRIPAKADRPSRRRSTKLWVDVLSAALFTRFLWHRFAEKILSATRTGFAQPKALQP